MNALLAKKGKMRIGVISDTHGLLRPEACDALEGVDLFIHAGDVGGDSILSDLKSIAPVIAVRGNMDHDAWAYRLPPHDTCQFRHHLIYVIHDLNRIDLDPSAAGVSVVISGHSHTPSVKTRDGVLYLNPGSAGPRRFKLPVSVAILHLNGKSVRAEIVMLKV